MDDYEEDGGFDEDEEEAEALANAMEVNRRLREALRGHGVAPVELGTTLVVAQPHALPQPTHGGQLVHREARTQAPSLPDIQNLDGKRGRMRAEEAERIER